MIVEIVTSFIVFLAIMDPFAAVPLFVAITRKQREVDRVKSANLAVFVAGLVLFSFAIMGGTILQLLGVSLPSFQVAGGIVLAIMGLQLVFGVELAKPDKDVHIAAVVIGTPLITGPGAISTAMLLSQQNGPLTPLLGGGAALFVTWMLLRRASDIQRTLGSTGIGILSRMMGLLLVAFAVEMIRRGFASA